MIELKNVAFHYKNTDAFGKMQKIRGVEDITLSIGRGEFVVFAGNSGCGKTTNLDAAGIDELRKILALWKSQGKTVIVAEHRLYFLRELMDRLFLMKDGRIVEVFPSEEIKALTESDLNARGLRSLQEKNMPEEPVIEKPESGDLSFLICRNFQFYYKHSENGIDFPELRFARGKITAILGKNGMGKSTFARVLCGVEKRAKGTVIFDGREWYGKKRMELCYMIMQDVNHQLFTDSVLEEVLLSMSSSIAVSEREKRAGQTLEDLGLLELANTHPMALSGGQKQRVAIACAVVSEAPVLLFDEPTSGLDLFHMRQVAGVLKKLKEDGRTVLVITHDTELVLEAADDVVRLSG